MHKHKSKKPGRNHILGKINSTQHRNRNGNTNTVSEYRIQESKITVYLGIHSHIGSPFCRNNIPPEGGRTKDAAGCCKPSLIFGIVPRRIRLVNVK